jgi:large subunit ribosomal protein L19
LQEKKKVNTLDLVNEIAKERAISVKKTKDGDNYTDLPDFREGDTITVAVRVVEGDKERIQNFKGIVIGIRGAGISKSFTIRKISNGVGVERIFPFYSPMIQSITLEKKGRVRRAKLYYLRGMSEKKIRQKLS